MRALSGRARDGSSRLPSEAERIESIYGEVFGNA